VIRETVKRALASPVGWRFAAPVRKTGCFVLTYHRLGRSGDPFSHLDADLFERQMEWVQQNCEPIAPDQVQQAALRPSRTRPPVLVTFDDAYSDFYQYAYPVLKRLGVPAVCFVPTEYIDRRLPFWWDLLHASVTHSDAPEVRLPWSPSSAVTMDDAGRAALLRASKDHIKQLPDDEKEPIVARLVAELRVDPGALNLGDTTMTWAQIREAADVTTFGGHTHTHAIMPLLDTGKMQWEVDTCRDRLEAETGARPRLFAYPSGAFNEAAKAAVRRGGFDLGFSTLEGVNGRATDWLEIRRVHAPRSVDALAWLLSGASLEMATPRGSGPT
jgi:peptidoglycan/xylan/chitin deacetylase (PgdA/CDA1 family)